MNSMNSTQIRRYLHLKETSKMFDVYYVMLSTISIIIKIIVEFRYIPYIPENGCEIKFNFNNGL